MTTEHPTSDERWALLAAGRTVPTMTDTCGEQSTPTRCGCPVNEAGDIRCHRCGERVNVTCWNCRTPRGEGPCPNPAPGTVPAMTDTACDVCGSYEPCHTHGPDLDDEQCPARIDGERCQRIAGHRGEHNPIPWTPTPVHTP